MGEIVSRALSGEKETYLADWHGLTVNHRPKNTWAGEITGRSSAARNLVCKKKKSDPWTGTSPEAHSTSAWAWPGRDGAYA